MWPTLQCTKYDTGLNRRGLLDRPILEVLGAISSSSSCGWWGSLGLGRLAWDACAPISSWGMVHRDARGNQALQTFLSKSNWMRVAYWMGQPLHLYLHLHHQHQSPLRPKTQNQETDFVLGIIDVFQKSISYFQLELEFMCKGWLLKFEQSLATTA